MPINASLNKYGISDDYIINYGKYIAKRIINEPILINSEPYLFQKSNYISCLVLSNSLKKD